MWFVEERPLVCTQDSSGVLYHVEITEVELQLRYCYSVTYFMAGRRFDFEKGVCVDGCVEGGGERERGSTCIRLC